MNRLLTLIAIGFAGLLAGCGSSANSSTQPGSTSGVLDVYSMDVSPDQFTLNAGDWSSITGTVDVSKNNATPKPLAPQPILSFYSSDPRVTVSPAGEVCAGLWDARYLTCTATVNPTTGLPDLPTGFVTITAFNASHNVSGTSLVSVHVRAVRITLGVPAANIYTGPVTVTNGKSSIPVGDYPSTTQCISQNNAVQYTASAVDANGTPIPNCSVSAVAGCINNDDYIWSTDNATAAQVSEYGFVSARNPGLANVYATLNGTVSTPLAFVTCPPESIVLSTSPYTSTTPVCSSTNPDCFTTADLTGLNKGDRTYVTATINDTNGLPLITAPLTFITSDPLIGSFASFLPLTSTLTANTSGRFSMMASCGAPSCNAAVGSFISPAGPGTGTATGFGYPVYSNAIGSTVQGTTSTTVLVTGTVLPNTTPPTPAHRLLVYDSTSLSLIQIVSLANLPNSLVAAPNGATAYVGSSTGLIVVNLTTYQPTLAWKIYPIVGGLSTDVITGTVLGVSPDSRYVVLSDVANGLVFFIDTTGTKVAQRFNIPNITSVAFAPDDSNFWIGGAGGVYEYQSDAFVPIGDINSADKGLSSNVNSLAWTPDGQSFFASGDQLINYSNCNDKENQQLPTGDPLSTVTNGLSTTVLPSAPGAPGAVPHLLGLDGNTNEWFDYAVTSSSEVLNQTVATVSALVPGGAGNVCNSTVSVNLAVTPKPSTLKSTAQQIAFSPIREQEYVTAVNPSGATPEFFIHGYDVLGQDEIKIPTLAAYDPVVPLSGGVLTDGSKLYFGTYDSTNGALLHRIDLATQTEDFVQQEVVNPTTGVPTTTPPTYITEVPATVGVVPSFVAVVPK